MILDKVIEALVALKAIITPSDRANLAILAANVANILNSHQRSLLNGAQDLHTLYPANEYGDNCCFVGTAWYGAVAMPVPYANSSTWVGANADGASITFLNSQRCQTDSGQAALIGGQIAFAATGSSGQTSFPYKFMSNAPIIADGWGCNVLRFGGRGPITNPLPDNAANPFIESVDLYATDSMVVVDLPANHPDKNIEVVFVADGDYGFMHGKRIEIVFGKNVNSVNVRLDDDSVMCAGLTLRGGGAITPCPEGTSVEFVFVGDPDGSIEPRGRDGVRQDSYSAGTWYRVR